MTPKGRFLGAALAGGRSRRFGRDKAVEEIGGVSLVERTVRALRGAAAEVVVISDRELPVSVVRLPDLRSAAGPLAGIETALTRARERDLDGALVLACDMPLVSAATLTALVAAAASGAVAVAAAGGGGAGGRDGAGGRRDVQSGSRHAFEPLCAAYPLGVLADVSALLDEGARAAGALFERVGGEVVECPSKELLNVNTQADAKVASALLREGR